MSAADRAWQRNSPLRAALVSRVSTRRKRCWRLPDLVCTLAISAKATSRICRSTIESSTWLPGSTHFSRPVTARPSSRGSAGCETGRHGSDRHLGRSRRDGGGFADRGAATLAASTPTQARPDPLRSRKKLPCANLLPMPVYLPLPCLMWLAPSSIPIGPQRCVGLIPPGLRFARSRTRAKRRSARLMPKQ